MRDAFESMLARMARRRSSGAAGDRCQSHHLLIGELQRPRPSEQERSRITELATPHGGSRGHYSPHRFFHRVRHPVRPALAHLALRQAVEPRARKHRIAPRAAPTLWSVVALLSSVQPRCGRESVFVFLHALVPPVASDCWSSLSYRRVRSWARGGAVGHPRGRAHPPLASLPRPPFAPRPRASPPSSAGLS